MEKRKEEVSRRPLYVYDLPKDILTTLIRKEGDGPTEQENVPSDATTGSRPESRAESSDGSKACSLCGVTFHTVDDQRSHVRSDLHGYNLKQRIRGASPVTENEFEKLVGDLNESLSGSDSEDSEDDDEDTRKETTLSALLKKQAAITSQDNENGEYIASKRQKRGSGKPPLLWFTTPSLPVNTYLGIYRAIFTKSEQENEPSILNIIQKKQIAPVKQQTQIPTGAGTGVPLPEAYKGPHVFLCMIGGGHFAAMVVSLEPKQTKHSATGPLTREATVLAHKTFHRYTTRRKQGGAQSANDSAKGAAHSAGASIRRYNEQALTDEVRQLLQDWKDMIDSSDLLFIRATGNTNRRTLFGPYDGQALRQNDNRIRGFPFSTRRATQNELMRSFVELTRVKVREVDETAILAAKQVEDSSKQPAKPIKPSALAAPKRTEEEETALLHTTQIQALIRRSKLPALLSYLKSNELSPNFHFEPKDTQQNHHAPTPLHLAANQNSAPLVTGLLIKAGANPAIQNAEGKTPFEITGDRATRDAFRVARSELGESTFLWDEANVPSPLTKAEADTRSQNEKAEVNRIEQERRRVEEERLKREGPAVKDVGLGKAAGRGRALVLAKNAQEKREEEARGLTPEMRMKLDRERRARAAEARMSGRGGGG